jgi:phosphopantothenoylcysteine decarboxylase/phosphopantothenate--cysteine ligase
MNRLLITSGPTREFLDPIRFLTNSSSGQMGRALAAAALEVGYEVAIVSGPVPVTYPAECHVVNVVSTQDMLEASLAEFPHCQGVIAAAAPCDYRVKDPALHKIKKSGQPLTLELHETPDILEALAAIKRPEQFSVGFALETQEMLTRGQDKMRRKSCQLMVLNGPEAMQAADTSVTLLDRSGEVFARHAGTKPEVAREILAVIASLWPPSGDRLVGGQAGVVKN